MKTLMHKGTLQNYRWGSELYYIALIPPGGTNHNQS
eukprot:UN19951